MGRVVAMSDFYQDHQFTTLHRLARLPLEEFERGLSRFSKHRRMALLLPSLAEEMDGEALVNIIGELREVPYLHRVVIALDRASEADYRRALEFFSGLPQQTTIVWLDGRRARQVFREFDEIELVGRTPGKGQAVWFALGHLLGLGDCHCVALHDCDILTYDRYLLGRLCFPILRPDIDFKYAKAYYPRISDRLNGRVCRLFVAPLLTALRTFYPEQPFLSFLAAFRYPLSGEMAMDLDLARHIRIPSDWGLEVGLLAEVYRNLSLKQMCQVDVAGRYDHRHKKLEPGDPDSGLMRMVRDITSSILRTMASQGAEISRGVLASLESSYLRTAQEYVERYAFDAMINGFPFDRHKEERAAEAFGRALIMAGEHFLEDLVSAPLLPNWNRMVAAIPDIMDRLAALPFEDCREYEEN
jgi:glucosyl-3-phosphoglycerate synthase